MRRYLILVLLATGCVAPMMASAEDDLTSLSYISYLERYATVQPASQDDHLEALINMPLVGGDRLDTAREARVEIQLADGATVWLDEYSSLSLDTVAFSRDSRSDRTVLFLAAGQLMAEIPPDALGEHASRVDSPSASIDLNRGGLYRVSALPSDGLRVEVFAGVAETSLASGGVQVAAGSAAEVRGAEITTSTLAVGQDDLFAQSGGAATPTAGRRERHPGRRAPRPPGLSARLLRRLGLRRHLQHLGLAAVGRDRVAALHPRQLVLDPCRLFLAVVRAVGLAALPLRQLVVRPGLRLGVVLGLPLGPGLGQLDVLARLRRLVPGRLLQLLVVGQSRLLSTAGTTGTTTPVTVVVVVGRRNRRGATSSPHGRAAARCRRSGTADRSGPTASPSTSKARPTSGGSTPPAGTSSAARTSPAPTCPAW